MRSNRFKDGNSEDALSNPYALSYVQKFQLARQAYSGNKPVVVVVDDIEGGVLNKEQVAQYFAIKGLEIVPVSPAVGLNHPIFKTNRAIHGIFLPGGPNILADLTGEVTDPEECKGYAARRRFEKDLIKMGEELDVPVIGICRGHQAIGNFYGAHLKDLTSTVVSFDPVPKLMQMSQHDPKIFVDPVYTFDYTQAFMHNPTTMYEVHNSNSTDVPGVYHRKELVGNNVTVHEGSQLFNAIEREFKENKPAYTFGIYCAHNQYLTTIPANSKLKATMSTPDGIIEGVECKTGTYLTMGIQHHPEEYRDIVGQNHRKHLIEKLREKADQRTSDASDPGLMQYLEYKDAREIAEINEERPQEKGAKAQLGLFIDQVQHKYCQEQPQREENPQEYGRRLAASSNPVTDEPGFEDSSSTPVVTQPTSSLHFVETARGFFGGVMNFFNFAIHAGRTSQTRSYYIDTQSHDEVGSRLSSPGSPVAFFQNRSSFEETSSPQASVSEETTSANETVTTSVPVAQSEPAPEIDDNSLVNKPEYHTFG